MPSVHGGIGGFDTEPGTLWPLGDTVGMAALGLLEVSLRDLGLRWRVLGVEELEVLAGRGRPLGGKLPPIRVDCGGLCRGMRASAAGDWPGLVEDFVRELIALRTVTGTGVATGISTGMGTGPGFSSGVGVGAAGASWSRVEGMLRSRVVPTAVLPGLLVPGLGPEAVLCQQLTEDLVEVVEVRSGEGLRLARDGELAAWGVTRAAAVHRGRENVRAEGPLDGRRFTSEDAPLIALSGTGFYVPTHLHWLRQYLADEPGWSEQNGALVALPHRHLMAAHVIESAAVEHAAGALARFAFRQFETCPGPVSDQLYWWCGDQLTRLPSDSVGETLQIFPTNAFAVLLARLRRDG